MARNDLRPSSPPQMADSPANNHPSQLLINGPRGVGNFDSLFASIYSSLWRSSCTPIGTVVSGDSE